MNKTSFTRQVERTVCAVHVDVTTIEDCEEVITTKCSQTQQSLAHASNVVGHDTRVGPPTVVAVNDHFPQPPPVAHVGHAPAPVAHFGTHAEPSVYYSKAAVNQHPASAAHQEIAVQYADVAIEPDSNYAAPARLRRVQNFQQGSLLTKRGMLLTHQVSSKIPRKIYFQKHV